MPQIVPWPLEPGDGSPASVEACRQALVRGELAVLPTEAGYVAAASGLHPEAVARLAGWRAGDHAPLPAVAVRGPADARDWVPDLGPLGRRLAQRCWPGPVVLVFAQGVQAGVATRLPDGVVRTVGPGWEMGLTAPDHPAVRELLVHLSVPLVLGELTDPAGAPALTAEAAGTIVGDGVAVVLDGGTAQLGRPATVVEVRGEQWAVRREGAVPAADLARLAAKLVLFVCTGNTCRSPLAEALCKKLLADRLGCAAEELPGRGYVVMSAGLAAVRGEPAATEAVAVAGELGADLSGHASRPATPDLLAQADVIVGMTAGHLHTLAGFTGPGGGSDRVVRLLCGESDLPDPIGGDRTVYQACAGTIWQHMQGLVAELLEK
ncbi:MAG TPA: Sua5/YciO/YrdC/YwlC family protein [Gemmataceae bacterium]|jgi:protein-tyrosine phosphatase